MEVNTTIAVTISGELLNDVVMIETKDKIETTFRTFIDAEKDFNFLLF